MKASELAKVHMRARYAARKPEYVLARHQRAARLKGTDRGAYIRHRENARRRGIEWQFTFDSWCGWWGTDSKFRGNKPGHLVCARFGDVGPYSVDNCYKSEHNANLQLGAQRYIVEIDKQRAKVI